MGLWSETSNSRNADSKMQITSSPIRNGTGAECKLTNRVGSMYWFTRWDRARRSHMPVRSMCTRSARAFSQLLSNIRGSLSFSHTENPALFILGRDGTTIAAPDPDADEVNMQRS